MKTSIQIPDALLELAEQVARRDNTTLSALLEEGLRSVVARRASTPAAKPFSLRKASFRGNGLQEPFADVNWNVIHDTIYDGRGG